MGVDGMVVGNLCSLPFEMFPYWQGCIKGICDFENLSVYVLRSTTSCLPMQQFFHCSIYLGILCHAIIVPSM